LSRERLATWKTAYDSVNVAAPVARPVARPTPPRKAAEPAAPAARTRVVTCERNKFGLMMCY